MNVNPGVPLVMISGRRPMRDSSFSIISRRTLLWRLACGLGMSGLARLWGAQEEASPISAAPGLPANSRDRLQLPFRHIHLDFHTSPGIPSVGEDFTADEFVRVLKEAAVNSITVFAKCHQGMSYYPTKVGARHPGLQFDLLGETIEACHKVGIRVSVYLSTMYDQHIWQRHGNWRVLDAEGREDGHRGITGPLTPMLGRVCINTPYLDYLIAQAEEVLKGYDVDGIFYDNYLYRDFGCCGSSCMREREKLGLDSTKKEDRLEHARMVLRGAMDRLGDIVRQHKPKASVYFNGPISLHRNSPEFIRSVLKHYTHIEIEALPGGSWGYAYFPVASRYLRNLGLDCMGMTGAFHRSWGDFGSVRNQAALDYECFSMLAQGMKCAIGDHLHPSGRPNRVTYERIGRTYRSVAKKEPWCTGARTVTEIAFLTVDAGPRSSGSDLGAARMLSQLHHQFDMLDRESDFARYKLILFPDSVRLDNSLRKKLKDYLTGGGKVILSHESGLDEKGRQFALPEIGIEYEGPWKHEVQYLEVLKGLNQGLPDMVHVAYEKGCAVKARQGTTILGRIWSSYFDRDHSHFQVEQTPFSTATDYVAVAARSNVIYIAVPIFRMYTQFGYKFYRQLVGNCIRRLVKNPLIKTEGPSTAEITVTEQGGRLIVHLLHYVPERRGGQLDVVEDVIPLMELKVALRMAQRPRQSYLAPQRQNLAFDYVEGYVRFVVPVVKGHQMVVFET